MAVRKVIVSAAKPMDFNQQMAEINGETDVVLAEIRAAKYSSRSLGNAMREIEPQRELDRIKQDAENAYYLFLAAKKKNLDLQLAAYSEFENRQKAASPEVATIRE